MLKEVAVADAYGAGFEFSDKRKIQRFNDLNSYSEHDLYKTRGKYTDDTQMSIAIAELVVSDEKWHEVNIASKFVDCFKRDPRKGYSHGFYDVLDRVDNGFELLSSLRKGSVRNGAAMRSMPIGFIKDELELLEKAEMQAKITHDSEMGVKSSCAVAMAANFGLHQAGRVSDLEAYLESVRLSDWDFNWCQEATVLAYDTVSAAFSCLVAEHSIAGLLGRCINLGGDTDSVASIAVGLATCFDEYDKTIPSRLLAGLDETSYGIEFLELLDEKLIARAF
ncbi:crystallin J1 [Thalassolituus sp. HI0120]|nr:crystallin J1 [Thalassolituus sp. HI0120]